MSAFTRDQITHGYDLVPNGLWTLPVSSGARVLLGWLHSHSDAFLSTLTVNKCRRMLGTSSITKYLEELEPLGFVGITRGEKGSSWSFHLFGPPWIALSDRKATEPTSAHHRADLGAPTSARVEEPGVEQPEVEVPDVVDVVGPEHALCEMFADLLRERGHKATVSPTWIRDMDRLIRLDDRKPHQIERVIRWLHDGSDDVATFWRSNILSPASLRAQWVRMSEQYNARTQAPKKKSMAEEAIERIRNRES